MDLHQARVDAVAAVGFFLLTTVSLALAFCQRRQAWAFAWAGWAALQFVVGTMFVFTAATTGRR